MISLNGVTLDNDLLWANEYDNPKLAQSMQRTVGGNLIITSMDRVKGDEIQLVASGSGSTYSGSFTKEQIDQFKNLELLGTSVNFVYEGITKKVIVKAGGVAVTPIIARPNQASTDLYIGTLTLIEV